MFASEPVRVVDADDAMALGEQRVREVGAKPAPPVTTEVGIRRMLAAMPSIRS
jgi:hypothetical protein